MFEEFAMRTNGRIMVRAAKVTEQAGDSCTGVIRI